MPLQAHPTNQHRIPKTNPPTWPPHLQKKFYAGIGIAHQYFLHHDSKRYEPQFLRRGDGMYIDESLAKGLTSRLWNEIDDLGAGEKSIKKYLKTHKIKFGTRTAWQKLNEAFQTGFEHNILATTRSGTRNNPILFYAILDRNRLEDVSDWQEKSFNIVYRSMDAWGISPGSTQTFIRIGEHAVSRYFQRHPEIYNADTSKFDIFNIINEFRSIAFLAQGMHAIFYRLINECKHPHENITIPFVTRSGIFLGSYNKELNTCDIRTYIANHQLTVAQVALAERARTIFDDPIFRGLPFFQLTQNDSDPIELYLFLSQLNEVATQFSEIVTWNENNSVIKREFQKSIISILAEHEHYDQVLIEHRKNAGDER